MKISKKTENLIVLLLLAISAVALIVVEIFPIVFSNDTVLNGMWKEIFSRGICGVAMVFVLMSFRYKIFSLKPSVKSLIWVVPCLCVAIVNFPFSALANGTATIVYSDAKYILIFILDCVCIGLMEETVFRGIVFGVILEKLKSRKNGIFLSVVIASLVFSLSHLINLAYGADFFAVALQVGYTFLIGAMFCVIMLKTNNLWFCILIHALFDVGGTIVTKLGSGSPWDATFWVLTVIVGLWCAVHVIFTLKNAKSSFVDNLHATNE